LRSGLVSQANLLSCSLNCELSEAASASSSIANATIAGSCKISHGVWLALIVEVAAAILLNRSTQGSVGALAVVLS
jgi:N-methylhydantoinase B/oxoprolinase/acetone carboxylase alpha subunit